MNLLQFFRNFVQAWLYGSLYVCEGLKFCVFILVFWFYIKQSASLLTGGTIQKWSTGIKIMTLASLGCYTVYGVQYLVLFIVKPNGEGFCHSFQFIGGGLL